MTGPNTGDTTNATPAATPAPRPATATSGGAAPIPPAPAGGTVSARPTASPSQAGHNPNVIVPRAQMTPGQRRALDRHNADAVRKRDEVVTNYLRSVLPSDEPEPTDGENLGERSNSSDTPTPNGER